VVGAGLADEILPLDRIAAALIQRVQNGRMARPTAVTR
jgi:two-component system chemotaxis response regulator CheB